VTRPDRLVVVLGTGTGVGKTWVSARTLRRLRDQGVAVAARKPAQSFAPGDPDDPSGAEPTDAEILARATGEVPTDVCVPRHWYPRALAPPMAADALGRPEITIDGLARDLTPWLASTAVGLVEGAGGVRSPIAHDGDNLALAGALAADLVVLVADAGLGTINAVRLSAEATGPVLVVLNHYDETVDLHRRNHDWLEQDGLEILTGPAELTAHLHPETGGRNDLRS